MPELQDFWSGEALLPSLAAALASAIGIHSLLLPEMTATRKNLCKVYVGLTIVIFVGFIYYGAIIHERSRQSTQNAQQIQDNIDRVRGLSGNNPNLTGPQVLQGILQQFSQPYGISDAQTSKLSEEFYYLKSQLPNPVTIRRAPADGNANVVAFELSNALYRASIANVTEPQVPSSPSDVGIMFDVADQNNPPPIVLKLQKVFDLVNINTKVINSEKSLIGAGGFSIFVGQNHCKICG